MYGTTSEFFGITARLMHLGPLQTIQSVQKSRREMNHLRDEYQRVKGILENPSLPPYHRAQATHARDRILELLRGKLLASNSIQISLLEGQFVRSCLKFYHTLAVKVLDTAIFPETRGKGTCTSA